jgi:dynein heavy chain
VSGNSDGHSGFRVGGPGTPTAIGFSKMGEPPKALSTDHRTKWFEARVTSAWGKLIKLDKILKLTTSEVGEKAFKNFCETEGKVLYVFEHDGDLCASVRTPSDRKKKILAFVKGENAAPVRESELSHKITIFDLHPEILRQLLGISSEVYFPILTNQGNQAGLPDVIAKDLIENFHRFLAITYVVIGHMSGKTMLPLPPVEVYSSSGSNQHNKESVHVLETSIVAWAHQIKDVLQLDPENVLKGGKTPGPQAELDFWTKKAENLDSIDKQLKCDKVKQIIRLLEVTKSTYFPAFNRLCKEVMQARTEAYDNVAYLNAVSKFLQMLVSEPFSDIVAVFKPLMHTILLVWKHSKFYNTPCRLVVLMREICNDLIRQAASFVSGEQLFEMEPQDAVDALKVCLRVSVTFKSTYFDYKARASTECPSNPWRFQNSALFSRLDSFLERCHDVLDLMQTIVQFSKLERIEVGGSKGKALTARVQQIFAEFEDASMLFRRAPEKIMNVEHAGFDDDFYAFRCVINELERRLAAVIAQAFDDSTTVLGRFKLFDAFESLLERELILADLERKNSDLLRAYASDLKTVQEIFISRQQDPPIADNAPPHAGAVFWGRGMMERVEEPMARLKGIGKAVLESEEGKEIVRAHLAIMTSLKEYETSHIENWCVEQENTGLEKLKQNLLCRNESDTALLRVNFDPALVCLLREVQYFKMLNVEVPDSAQRIFEKNETYRQHTGNLELVSENAACCTLFVPVV